ncbi:hypothetical protein F4780DRAFT_761163 [Xylariomycetidae sp. FL0641]|nr:hypothetical protein F4780DRAFT_761163 [Xylariomycetidae sp. FL0641]
MAGRRRRAPSVSTVATVDEDAIKYYQETSVLKATDNQSNADDWPCFLLVDATVYHRDGTIANLLHVDLEGPFIIRGRVEVERDQQHFLVHRSMKTRSPWIQIQNTVSFSIGLKEDGVPIPILWASGAAGWYEIVPSDRYKATCDLMYQGVSLQFAVLDQFEDALARLHAKKKNRHKTLSDVKLDMDEVLFKYAVIVGDGVTLSEAYERVETQAVFLLSHFPKGTLFWNMVAQRSPQVAAKLAERESKEIKTEPAVSGPSPLEAVVYSPREESSSVNLAPKPPKPKRRSPSEAVVSVQTKTGLHITPNATEDGNPPSAAEVIVGALRDIREQYLEEIRTGKKKKQLQDISAKSWQTMIYQTCNIKPYAAHVEVCQYHAQNMVRLLGPEFHDTQIYQWAKANMDNPVQYEHISEAEILKVVRRKKAETRRVTHQEPSTPVRPVESLQREGDHPRRGRPSGKTSGLRPSFGSKKRLRHETDPDAMDLDEDGIPQNISKKSRYASDEDLAADASSGDEGDLPVVSKPLTRVAVRAEKIPSSTPEGPNQTWTCQEEGCEHVIRAADEEEGQARINAHLEEHVRTELAVEEGKNVSRPVNYLLEKIQRAGENQRRNGAGLHGASMPPPPIKRAMPI